MIKSNRAVGFVRGHMSIIPSLTMGINRTMSQRAASQRHDDAKSTHWYRNLFPWKKPSDVAEMLQKNIIYENDDIIAFNKPFDLPMHSLKYDEHSTIAVDPRLGDVSVQAALPLLKKAFNLDQPLVPIFSQHRSNSGVMVMAKSKKAVDFYARNFNINKTNKLKHQKYCALTLGIPEEKTDVPAYMTKNPPKHFAKATISHKRPSKNQRQSPMSHGRIMSAMLDCRVLAESRELSQVHVAAVELNTSASNWELLQAYCVECLCPILGEYNHATRVKTVLGKPVLMKSFDQSKPVPPLHALLCHHLGISENESLYMPTHLHCFELTLRDMSKPKQGQLVLQAPLPNFFSKTLERLNLTLPADHTLSEIPPAGRGVPNLAVKKPRKHQREEKLEGTDVLSDSDVSSTVKL